jgi:hypothetical protein
MKPQTTYTFAAAGSSNFYQWMPRITVKSPGRQTCYIVTEATYRRFVRLANSGRYHVAIEAGESVAWTLSRKPQLAFAFEQPEQWAVVDGLNQRIDW